MEEQVGGKGGDGGVIYKFIYKINSLRTKNWSNPINLTIL